MLSGWYTRGKMGEDNRTTPSRTRQNAPMPFVKKMGNCTESGQMRYDGGSGYRGLAPDKTQYNDNGVG